LLRLLPTHLVNCLEYRHDPGMGEDIVYGRRGHAAGVCAPLWLAMGALVVLALPVHDRVIAGGSLLAAFTALAFLGARRCTSPATATMVWWSPLLPVVVSLYLLALVLF